MLTQETKTRLFRVLNPLLESLAQSKMNASTNEFENELVNFLKDLFWGFSFACSFREQETLKLFQLLLMLRPKQQAFQLLKKFAENITWEFSAAEMFLDFRFLKLILALVVVDLNFVLESIRDDEKMEFFQIAKDLHKLVYNKDIGVLIELMTEKASRKILKYKNKVSYLSISFLLKESFYIDLINKNIQENQDQKLKGSIRDNTNNQISESIRNEHHHMEIERFGVHEDSEMNDFQENDEEYMSETHRTLPHMTSHHQDPYKIRGLRK